MSDIESDYDVDKKRKGNTLESNEKVKEVRLNRAILIKGISKVNCDKREPSDVDKQFPRVTHLHLQNKGIDILDSLHHFRNLTVLYLYDNRIHEIMGLEDVTNLEALYLQRNRLERINGLLTCKKLRKLYLGQNEILVVEGLQSLIHLEELHIEEQRLQRGEHVIFDPTTLDTLSTCLQILNINGNKIKSLEDLAGMRELHTMHAQDNAIEDLDQTGHILSTLKNIKVIDLRGNPMAKSPKYQEKIIANCNAIELLDGKSYSAVSCQFIKKFCDMKRLQLRQNLATLNLDVTNLDLSKTFPESDMSSPLQRKSSLDLSQNFREHELEQLYPTPSGDDKRNHDFSFPREDEINKRLAYLKTIGQYTSSSLQAKVIDLVHTPPNKHTKTRLIKPSEIALPQFILAPKSIIQKRSLESLRTKVTKTSTSDNDLEQKSEKSKVIKGLASRSFSAITHSFISPGTPGSSGIPHYAAVPSVSGMMPSCHSFTKTQPLNNLNNEEVNPHILTSKGSGDNFNHQKCNINQIFLKNSETKIFKLPPWPHILRNVESVQNVKFM